MLAAWEPQPDGKEVIVHLHGDAAGLQGDVAPICPKMRMPPVWQTSQFNKNIFFNCRTTKYPIALLRDATQPILLKVCSAGIIDMNTQNATSETGCCPRFNPEPWDEKEITWTEKLFVKDKVRSFLHIPLNFGQVMVKNMEKIEKAEASAKETIVLSDEKSMWGSDLYVAVEKDFVGADIVKISGTFLTKVFEGPYKDVSKWMRDMNSFVTSKGKTAKKTYVFYTTCPKCAKVYGKNYVVILAEV